jgi:hypothetical protein
MKHAIATLTVPWSRYYKWALAHPEAAWKFIPVEDLARDTCDADECWYRRNADCADELTGMYYLWYDPCFQLCDLCYRQPRARQEVLDGIITGDEGYAIALDTCDYDEEALLYFKQ